MECFEKLIKKDMIHPLTNAKLKEKDIIVMQRVSVANDDRNTAYSSNHLTYVQGGTGYSTTNESLEGKEKRPALQA